MSDKEDENQSQKANIPKLNGDNIMMWTMQIQSHLCRKNLYQYCEYLQESYTAPQSKKIQEAEDLIIQYMDDITFESIYASQSYNNKGRIWLNFIRHEFKGDIKTYIKEYQRLMNQLAIVCIKIPDDILSYTIHHKKKDLSRLLCTKFLVRLSGEGVVSFVWGSQLGGANPLFKPDDSKVLKSSRFSAGIVSLNFEEESQQKLLRHKVQNWLQEPSLYYKSISDLLKEEVEEWVNQQLGIGLTAGLIAYQKGDDQEDQEN
ncbi:hypothetical protein BY996DRAFT_6509343 [Phakopsora pachyrhizi]|nr:hypothetical protein BY996DRAFT_6509343 [Phakopsora pachyrhizi]